MYIYRVAMLSCYLISFKYPARTEHVLSRISGYFKLASPEADALEFQPFRPELITKKPFLNLKRSDSAAPLRVAILEPITLFHAVSWLIIHW